MEPVGKLPLSHAGFVAHGPYLVDHGMTGRLVAVGVFAIARAVKIRIVLKPLRGVFADHFVSNLWPCHKSRWAYHFMLSSLSVSLSHW
jgi:hypothetical protein